MQGTAKDINDQGQVAIINIVNTKHFVQYSNFCLILAITDIVNTKHFVQCSNFCLIFDFLYCYSKVQCFNAMTM
jgi:hypothetical protein